MVDVIKAGIIEAIKDGFIKFLTWLGISIISCSYWICLFVCIGALILYIAGMRKAGKYVGVSFIIYFVLQCLKVVF